jgi:hypothetical protein
MTFSCLVCRVCLALPVAAYDWIANNLSSTSIAVTSGGFWFAKPVELADMAARHLSPVRFGVTVERSSPHRLRRPSRFRIAGFLNGSRRAKRDCRSGRQTGIAP